jgi:hypothetical protein
LRAAVPRLSGYFLLVICLSALDCGLRFVVLQSSEPRVDQASFARWLQNIRHAKHVLPQRVPGASLQASIEGDSASFVHRYAIRIYNTVPYVFTTVALAESCALSLLTGDSYRAQVGLSILASAGVLLILGLARYWLKGEARGATAGATDRITGLAALLLAATSAYLHFWSAWGVHNWGLLSLLAAVALISRSGYGPAGHPERARAAVLLPLVAVTVFAVYSHWTNLFLLPPAVALLVLMRPEGRSKAGLATSAGYLAAVGACVVPVALLMKASRTETASTDVVFAAYEKLPALEFAVKCVWRAGNWFTTGATLFSLPGLVAALVGLCLLAWVRRAWLPLLVVAAHWACWVAVPGFTWNGSPTWLRTYPYVLIFFCLGAGYLLAAAWTGELDAALARMKPGITHRAFVLTAVALVCAHLVIQAVSFPRGTDAPRFSPAAQEVYARGQGKLRPMVQGVDRLMPGRATLLTWDYPLQDTYATLSARPSEQVILPPSVGTLWQRQETGRLTNYLKRRRLVIACDLPLFLLAAKAVARDEIERQVSGVLGAAGQGCAAPTVEPLAGWSTDVPNVDEVVLYRLRMPGQRQ